jgi:hypothetical protein
MRALKASLAYFAGVFAIGFALGIVRMTLLVPQFGVRTSELLELPIMVLASYLIAKHVVRHFGSFSALARVGIGLLALALLISAELGVTVLLGQSIGSYISSRDQVSGLAYLVSLALFGFMPLIAGRGAGA